MLYRYGADGQRAIKFVVNLSGGYGGFSASTLHSLGFNRGSAAMSAGINTNISAAGVGFSTEAFRGKNEKYSRVYF